MRAGWLPIPRDVRDDALWPGMKGTKFTKFEAWTDLQLRAAYVDREVERGGRFMKVKRGQILTSQKRLAGDWAWDRGSVAAFLRALERRGKISIETSKSTDTGYTLITLRENWQNWVQERPTEAQDTNIEPRIESTTDSASCIHPTIPRPSSDLHRPDTSNKGQKQKTSNSEKKGRQGETFSASREQDSHSSLEARRGIKGDPPGFPAFWEAWPPIRRLDRKRAVAEWRKLNPSAALVERILAAVRAWSETFDWQKEGGKYIPYPHRWIRDERWHDQVPPARGLPLLSPLMERNLAAVQAAGELIKQKYGPKETTHAATDRNGLHGVQPCVDPHGRPLQRVHDGPEGVELFRGPDGAGPEPLPGH
jgi:hypothetical protein